MFLYRSKKYVGVCAAIFVLMSALFLMSPKTTQAAINSQINFQGKLTNTDGTNVANGSYSIVFAIYSVASGGSALWSETQGSVSVSDGIFRVALGSVTSLPGSVDFNSNSLFLGVKVGADAEMTPRIQFTAAPYAFNSDRLGGVSSSGFIQLAPSSAQTDASTTSSIFLNKTSSGNFVQLQQSATNIFTIDNTGNLTLGQNSAKTISIAQTLSNAAGLDLRVAAGQGGAGAAANAGGVLTLQGGAGGGTNGVGGNLLLASGAGSGAAGDVLVKNPANTTTGFQIQNAAGTQLFSVDSVNNRIFVGNQTADATATLLVLDTYTTSSDPANGVNGAMYYNSGLHMYRCYRGINGTAVQGSWGPCGINEISRAFVMNEEFLSGLGTTGNVGELGWTLSTIGACTAPQYNTTVLPSANRPGILKMNTSATSGQGCTMNLNSGSWALAAGNTFLAGAAVGSLANPSQVLRIGLHNETTTTASPTTGVWWEANPATNANWQFCYSNATPTAVCAASATAIAATTFVSLEIRLNTTGVGTSAVEYFINGVRSNVSAVTVNTTNNVSPSSTCYSSVAGAQACYIDYIQVRGTSSVYR